MSEFLEFQHPLTKPLQLILAQATFREISNDEAVRQILEAVDAHYSNTEQPAEQPAVKSDSNLAAMMGECHCGDSYSASPHGDGIALYLGRCHHRHGMNLLLMTEIDQNRPDIVAKLVAGLNAQLPTQDGTE